MKMKIDKLEEDQSCQSFNLQFQRGIGPPPQTPLRRKMSGKKSTNRVSFRRKIPSTVVTIIFSIKNRVSAKIVKKKLDFLIFSPALQERRKVGQDWWGKYAVQ